MVEVMDDGSMLLWWRCGSEELNRISSLLIGSATLGGSEERSRRAGGKTISKHFVIVHVLS